LLTGFVGFLAAFNYSGINGRDPLKAAIIKFNNQPRISAKSGEYFRQVIPYQFHSSIPEAHERISFPSHFTLKSLTNFLILYFRCMPFPTPVLTCLMQELTTFICFYF